MLTKEQFLSLTYDSSKHNSIRKTTYAKHLTALQEFVDSNWSGHSIEEVIWLLANDLSEFPKCKICGRPVKFYGFKQGYSIYCSKNCAASDHDVPQEEPDKIVTKEAVIAAFIKDGEFISQKLLSKYLKKHGWFNPLMAYYSDTTSCFETIYRIVNDIDIRPVCKTCGGQLKFDHGFPRFCSNKCANADPDVLAKNADSVSKAMSKAYSERGEEIKAKRQKTLKETLGIDACTPFASQDIQGKAKQTIFDNHGVDNAYKIPGVHEKAVQAFKEKSKAIRSEQGYDVQYVEQDGKKMVLIKNGCPVHGDILIDWGVFNNRTKEDRRGYMTLCPLCNPLRNSETSIETALKNMLNEFGVAYAQHDRCEIKPYELDFYLSDKKLAIECNGIWWHRGEEGRDRSMLKHKLCEEKGIRLIYFWEDEIRLHPDKVKSYVRTLLGMNDRIYARQCTVKEIDSKTAREFLEHNHLQGSINSSVRLGLFYKDDLVQVMTFGKLRKCLGSTDVEGTYELYRLCSRQGLSIAGGASRLLKHFIEKEKPKRLVTYCSLDISEGGVYEKLGFSFVKSCGAGYWYVNMRTGERKSRFAMRKDIVDDGSGRTEKEINRGNGWLVCYDCGNLQYEMVF